VLESRRVSGNFAQCQLGHKQPVFLMNGWEFTLTLGTTVYSYSYDHLSRLINCATSGTVNARYAYDGWNRIAQYDDTTLQDTFTWGLDISGSMQDAGGVGGLLATRWVSSSNTDYFPTYDGNGNVSEYLATDGTSSVHYEYDPFGTLTRRTGSTSTRFQYRFSTKPRDINTGLYYYGYRYYHPNLGRWSNHDPIGEEGGLNLYGFVGNDAVGLIDIAGLKGLAPGIYGRNDLVEVDPQRLAILARVRSSVQNGTWSSREDAGNYGARAAAFTSYYGPRGYSDERDKLKGGRYTLEYGGRICCKCKNTFTDGILEYSLTGPFTSGGHLGFKAMIREECPDGTVEVGSYHSHPDPYGASPEDRLYEKLTDTLNANKLKNGENVKCINANNPSKGFIGELKGNSYRITTYTSNKNSGYSGEFMELPNPGGL
jgi:RHS repeat-associated protein